MYVTAQRVQHQPSDGGLQIGINAFLYHHERVFTELPKSDDYGTLVKRELDVESIGGNPVLSFLDVVAQDGEEIAPIERAIQEFVVTSRASSYYGRMVSGMRFEFGAVPGFATMQELGVLWKRIKRLLEQRVEQGTP